MSFLNNSCETEKKTNSLLYVLIIGLLSVIAVMAFFMWKNMWDNKWWEVWDNKVSDVTSKENNSDPITVTIIDDKRCTNCMTAEIVSQLKLVPFLTSSKFIEKDFNDEWISEYIKSNDIKKLPAIILSSNKINDEWKMQPYLKELKDKQYSLEVWASFDPFAKRSTKWFLTLDKETLNKIKSNTYLKWNKDAKVSWIEYSDLECPFCAKLHNSDVPSSIEKTYWDKINIFFNSFPLDFHKNAMPAARIIECAWEQKWSTAFYTLIEKAFKDEKSDKDYLIAEAVKLWINKANLEKCVTDAKFDTKITNQQKTWVATFGISWTPANILINNDTGEYEVLSWALPFTAFKETIDKLLK